MKRNVKYRKESKMKSTITNFLELKILSMRLKGVTNEWIGLKVRFSRELLKIVSFSIV